MTRKKNLDRKGKGRREIDPPGRHAVTESKHADKKQLLSGMDARWKYADAKNRIECRSPGRRLER